MAPCMRGLYNESEESGWIPAPASARTCFRGNDGVSLRGDVASLSFLPYPHESRKSLLVYSRFVLVSILSNGAYSKTFRNRWTIETWRVDSLALTLHPRSP